MKYLRLLLLALLVSCGQSLDTTSYADDEGDKVTIETNFNDLRDIQNCLNEGEYAACMRAKSKGFTAFPIFFDDIIAADTLKFSEQSFVFKTETTDRVIFKKNLRIHRGDYYANGSKFYTIIYITLEIKKNWRGKIKVTDFNGNLLSYNPWTNLIYRNGIEKWVDMMDEGWQNVETQQFNCNNFTLNERLIKTIGE